jgi:antitoxin component YwqK of YwqJK toxin-antitoxin module
VSHIETNLPEMKNYLVIFLTLTLIACGPSQDEKEKIAAVSCAVMEETRNMDGAIRVREMNAAREKIGGEPFLRGDAVIKEAFEYGLCEELVLDVAIYDETLRRLKYAKRERERIAAEKQAEEERIAAEKRAEKERIAAEKRAERQRIAAERQRIRNSKPTVKEEFHPNGELKERTNYQSKNDGGKKHGIYRLWSRYGKLRLETTYKDGKEHGLERWWHDNGQLRRETSYKDGEQHGFDRMWHEGGHLGYENCYSNGEEVDMSNCQG